jgi:hypothetical protein
MTYPEHLDREIPEADAAEQAITVRVEDDGTTAERSPDDEAPEWDAQEQHRVVELEDEYR